MNKEVKLLSDTEITELTLENFFSNPPKHIFAAHRGGAGKSSLTIEATIEAFNIARKGWGECGAYHDQYREHRLLDGTISGSITFYDPNPDKQFLRIIEDEWPIYNPKPKNNYKPHSFQPAKGEAPKDCKPNPKLVATNRTKAKLAKLSRKRNRK